MFDLIGNNNQQISETTDSKLDEVMLDFNNTLKLYPYDKNIAEMFEEQVAKTPNNIALCFHDIEITYQNLNIQANKLAHFFVEKRIKNNDKIGLLLSRCPDLIVSMLAILKAGCSYVPIDPDYPTDRQNYIIENSELKFIITNIEDSTLYDDKKTPYYNISQINTDTYSTENLHLKIDSHQLAYTIYTSGSTGRPKGVMIEHHSVINLVCWVNNTFNVCGLDRLLFITSVCFDLSVYDVFGILLTGGRIAIAEKKEVMNLSLLSTLIQEYKITFWDSVPSTLDFLIRVLETQTQDYVQTDLRLVFLSGDWIPLHLPERIKKFFPNAQVISLGGATEATVWSNFYYVKKIEPTWKSIPYGKPIDNNFFYILDTDLKPVPFGEKGELYIGGAGVARGYANDEEKTNYSYVKNPFHAEFSGKMYRTGDLGRMMPDGNMEFLGRKDNQVKIRGFRVELGEIESTLKQHKYIENAIVLAKDFGGTKRLAAYIVPKPKYDRDIIISFLKRKLPEYMVPGLYMELEQLPLNPNGKIDRNNLPEMTHLQLSHEFELPKNEMEGKVLEIWRKVLGQEDISVTDNFFDIGGQSLLAVHLQVELETQFNIKNNTVLHINTLFKHPSIRTLSAYLSDQQKEAVSYKYLVPMKAHGNKVPIYIISGDGFNISNFRNLANFLHEEQPVFSLQPIGMEDHHDEAETVEEIAMLYIKEIIHQNPKGPYALAGYSFGGFVAVEVKKQLEQIGKQVKFFGIFDTDATSILYKRGIVANLSKKLWRQIPKTAFIMKSLLTKPRETIDYQITLVNKRINKLLKKENTLIKTDLNPVEANLKNLIDKHELALGKYDLQPFTGVIHLFKASIRIYFVDDFKYLGWQDLAIDGVKLYEIPGDHKTMFLPPNVSTLSKVLQEALDTNN